MSNVTGPVEIHSSLNVTHFVLHFNLFILVQGTLLYDPYTYLFEAMALPGNG